MKNFSFLVCAFVGIGVTSTGRISAAAAQSQAALLRDHPQVLTALARAKARMPEPSAPPVPESFRESEILPAAAHAAQLPPRIDRNDSKAEAQSAAQTSCLYCKGKQGSLEFGVDKTILVWPCGHRSHVSCVDALDSAQHNSPVLLPYRGEEQEINIGADGDCGVCLEPLKKRPSVVLRCKHVFCLNCYLTNPARGCPACNLQTSMHARYRSRVAPSHALKQSSPALRMKALEHEVSHGNNACPDCRLKKTGEAFEAEQKTKKTTPQVYVGLAPRAPQMVLAPPSWDIADCVVCKSYIPEDQLASLPLCYRFKVTQGFDEHHNMHKGCANTLVGSGQCSVCKRGLSEREELFYAHDVATKKHAYSRTPAGRKANFKKFLDECKSPAAHVARNEALDVVPASASAPMAAADAAPEGRRSGRDAEWRSMIQAPAVAAASVFIGSGSKAVAGFQQPPEIPRLIAHLVVPRALESRFRFQTEEQIALSYKKQLQKLIREEQITQAQAEQLFNKYGFGSWDSVIDSPVHGDSESRFCFQSQAEGAAVPVRDFADVPRVDRPQREGYVNAGPYVAPVLAAAVALPVARAAAPQPSITRLQLATVATWFAASWFTKKLPTSQQRRARFAVAAATLPVAMVIHAQSKHRTRNVLISTLLLLKINHAMSR